MPTCANCKKPLTCTCDSPQPIGQTANGCALKKGALWIHVTDDEGKDVPNATVKKDGAEKKTKEGGLARWDPLDSKAYATEFGPLGDLDKDYEPPAVTTRQATVTDGAIAYVDFILKRKAQLKVKVVSKDGSKLFDKANVKMVTGKDVKPDAKSKDTGIADFGKVSADTYTLKAELDAEDAKKFATTIDFSAATSDVDLSAGDDKTVEIVAEPINFVMPKIEMEYKVVLLDRKLSDHQEGSETKIFADPTYVQVSVTQSKKDDHPFAQGGKLTVSSGPGAVKFFTDEACQTELTRDLTKDELTADTPTRIYLRGTTAGKFKLKLELNDPADRFVKRADPSTLAEKTSVEEEMGVVELKMEVHRFEKSDLDGLEVEPDVDPVATYHTNLKDKALPDQKALTDEKKVKEGRTLHAQDGKHFGRAKLILKKLTDDQWPTDTDEYLIVADQKKPDSGTVGEVELFDADATADAAGNKKDLPFKTLKVSDLKVEDKTFWVQGKTESEALRDVRLHLGLDRGDGGLDKKVKGHGDWGRFTVVKIDKVELDHTPTPGQPDPWDDMTKRWSINLKPADERDGRKIKLKATLTKKLAGLKIHFMLAPDKNNTKTANWGIDLPATWTWKDVQPELKHLDRATVGDRKKLMHVLAIDTNADGEATAEVWLSRFGGDKFQPGAYVDQDPHLAKYVHGHADLEKRKPVVATDSITVWRKFWYQIVKVEGLNPPGVGTSVSMFERVKATMKDCPDLNVLRATVDTFNPQAIYPRYMIEVNGGNADALVVSDSNKGQFFSGYAAEAEKPIKVPILICDAQWDDGGSSAAVDDTNLAVTDFPRNVLTDKLILSPPLAGGDLLVSGDWRAMDWDPAANGGAGDWVNDRSGALSNGDVSVSPTRSDLHEVTIALPAGVGPTIPGTAINIENLMVSGADGPYLGEYSPATQRILAVYDASTAATQADFFNTITHELGHGFDQVPTPGSTPPGIPDHPVQADLGQGNHCRHNTNKCVMYDSGPITGSLNNYCEKCQPYLVVQDMKKIRGQ